MIFIASRLALAMLLTSSSLAMAQTPAAQPMKDHRPFNAKEPAVDWKESNELVRALDGHMGHVKDRKKPLPPSPIRSGNAKNPTEPGKKP
jgi:hypothetical protein